MLTNAGALNTAQEALQVGLIDEMVPPDAVQDIAKQVYMSMYVYVYVFIYMYICIYIYCVYILCVCVCVDVHRERERERKEKKIGGAASRAH